jgi:hypothetical protein
MILGEGRRRIWRRLTNTTKGEGEISEEVRATGGRCRER